nr:unnamed protein product [Callosobruchus chinensis]
MRQYNTSFRLWWEYCKTKDLSPFRATPQNLISFLQFIIDTSHCKYGTINSHRSAISLISLESIGADPLVRRFLKGVSRLRPAVPKYNFTWDPHQVLNYLETIDVTSDEALKHLSQKLITLLALVTGHRIQTLALIKIPNIVKRASGVQIFISDFVKTSGVGKTQPCLSLPFFPDKSSLCAASTLLTYLEATKDIRPPSKEELFITYGKPHRVATKQTLSRWVKDTLLAAGIDTAIFKPHSTRHASASLAFRNGISVDVISRTVGWTEKSACFARFYNRPLSAANVFANAILSSS